MADNVDTLDFFGRLENRLALVATMTGAQGHRLVNLAEASADPVAGNLANELEALRVDVAAVVDEVRKLARHAAAVEALTIPAAALAQQMQADAQTHANAVADRRTWPASWADGIRAVDSRRAGDLDQPGMAPAPAVDLSALPGLRDMAEDLAAHVSSRHWIDDRHAIQATDLAHGLRKLMAQAKLASGASTTDDTSSGQLIRQLLELRGQGRLIDAAELARSDLLEQAELQAQALANLANAPALVSLDVLDEISARAAAMLGRLRQLVDTDARRRQLPAFDATGPAWPDMLAP